MEWFCATKACEQKQKRKRYNMKHQNNSNPVIRSSLALALAVVIWSPVQVRSAEPADGKMMMGGKMMSETNMMQRSEAMQEQRGKMAADLKAQDAQLAGQIYEMNHAAADKKLDLMAAIVTQMAAQRTAMNARMETMHEAMVKNTQLEQGKMSSTPIMEGMDTNSMGDGKPMTQAAMMAEMKAQDDQLAGQITEMNSAPADKKLDLMAAVLTQMAAQRRTAYLRMENMRGEMLQLRQMGKEPMSPDSMMKGMN
jgi:hypothetical protein